jgi:hypothetical protein
MAPLFLCAPCSHLFVRQGFRTHRSERRGGEESFECTGRNTDIGSNAAFETRGVGENVANAPFETGNVSNPAFETRGGAIDPFETPNAFRTPRSKRGGGFERRVRNFELGSNAPFATPGGGEDFSNAPFETLGFSAGLFYLRSAPVRLWVARGGAGRDIRLTSLPPAQRSRERSR